MKKLIVIVIAVIAIGIHAADLTTKAGKVYKDYEIISVTDKSVKIAHEDGAADVDIPDLPDDVKAAIADKTKAYKPPVITAKAPAEGKIIQGPTLTTPAPAAKPEVTEETTPDKELPESVKERNKEIATLKKEFKQAESDYKLKGAFANASKGNEAKIMLLKRKIYSIKEKISNLERDNQRELYDSKHKK
jgi:hypothetical protein